MVQIPLVKGMLADKIWKAFLLGTVSAAIAAVATIEVRLSLEKKHMEKWPEWKKITATLFASFLITMASYLSMYLLFGWGGGLLVNQEVAPPFV